MSDRIRFHLDEQVNSAIAIELRRRGIDVTTTVEAGLRTQRDDAHSIASPLLVENRAFGLVVVGCDHSILAAI